MPLPADWTVVQLRWSAYYLDGTRPSGFITATPAVTRFVDLGEAAADADAIFGLTFKVPIINGTATFSLPATNDPSVSPLDFTYLITEELAGGGGSSYSIEVPTSMAAGGIDLVEISPVVPSPGIPLSLVTRAEFDAHVAGGGGGAGTYTHTQSTPSASWTVNHSLGRAVEPTVLLDSAPTVPVLTDLTHPTLNQTVIVFPTAVTGVAYF